MADQVSRKAREGLSASFMRLLVNFLVWWYPGRPVVFRFLDERDKVDVRISVNFDLLCSLGHVTWVGAGCGNEGWAVGEWRDNGNIKVRGGTVWVKDKIHARVSIHRTSEGRDGLLDVHIGAAVCVDQIGYASGHCGMSAIDAAAASTSHSSGAVERPQACHRSDPLRFKLWQAKATPEGSGAAGCGNMSLLATDTRKQRSSAS